MFVVPVQSTLYAREFDSDDSGVMAIYIQEMVESGTPVVVLHDMDQVEELGMHDWSRTEPEIVR